MERKHLIFMLIAGLAIADVAGATYLWSLWPSRPGIAVKAAQHGKALLPTTSVREVLRGTSMPAVKVAH